MNRSQALSMLAALGLAAFVSAQAQDVSPQPSTSPTEGTAADRTPPGETPTREEMGERPPGMETPRPATSQTEGTAADRTPPGETQTPAGPQGATLPQAQGEAEGQEQGRELMGATVVSSDEAPLGKVVDVVFDAKGQPEFVVISTEQGKTAAVPYQASMKSGDKVVIDESRLQRAPTLKEGEWREASKTWKEDASRYWNEGAG